MIVDDADGNGVDDRANGVDAHAHVDAHADAHGVDADADGADADAHVDAHGVDADADADVDAQAGILREIEERPLVNRLLPIGKKGSKITTTTTFINPYIFNTLLQSNIFLVLSNCFFSLCLIF